MKILLTLNKTLSSGKNTWIDGGYWNVYLPLLELGHDVHLYDTVAEENDYDSVVRAFEPDLIYCCFTNDPSIAPREPWQQIKKYTESSEIITFNWFCDETWRFENFSKQACHYFNVCSTPEASYLEKFKREAGYENIILGLWHSNIDLFPKEEEHKKYDISFCGHLNHDRVTYVDYLTNNGVGVQHFHGLEHRDMLKTIAQSKIGINFSKNYNGSKPTLQIKGRMFEVPAAKTLLFTEYAPGLEKCYEIDKEIVTFKSPKEMMMKAKMLLERPEISNMIAQNGYDRFIRDHESKIRLTKLLKEIVSL
jgi:spore maturation protein CgeB